jgi:hypothetical protein
MNMTEKRSLATSARGLWAVLALVVVVAAWPARAEARGGGPFSKDVGLGLEVGFPTALTLELKLSRQTGLDIAIGLDDFDNDDSLYLHVDYLVYLVDLAGGGGRIGVPLYLGVGPMLYTRDYDNRDDRFDDFNFGLRVPFGLALAFRTAPVQIFAELAIGLLLVDEYDNNDNTWLGGAVGFRVYF